MAKEKPEKKTKKKSPKTAEKKAEKKTEEKTDESFVLIGQKPVMKYVLACLTSFNSGAERVVVKARGRAISRAVDTTELLRRAFLKDVEVEKIEIGTEEMARPDRPKSNVSTMEIVLVKKPETAKK
jgi:DNA-binding protein